MQMEFKLIDSVVGKRIRKIRNEKGLSQKSIADAIGITFQQIQKYEKGQNGVSVKRLIQLSHVLDTPVDVFIDQLYLNLSPVQKNSKQINLPAASDSNNILLNNR
jgi:transcriptional regulator with XRE-family HTH domain